VALQIFPAAMVPGGKLWSLLLLWCVSYHAGEGFERAGAPKALGMLVAGLVLRSLPHGKDLSYPLDIWSPGGPKTSAPEPWRSCCCAPAWAWTSAA
jgi:hypothetical protein